jgi:hypothetical protein
MTETPKKKAGRPATGRDQAVSVRLPKAMIATVQGMADYMGQPTSAIFREAMRFGLLHMQGEKLGAGAYIPFDLRPQHAAEIHEAGHAVAVFLCAEEEGLDPAECLLYARLKQRGGGAVFYKPFPPMQDLRITVAGAVAESLEAGLSFSAFWNDSGCSGDRKHALATMKTNGLDLDDAVDFISGKFFQPQIWTALVGLSREFNVNGTIDGAYCWDIYRSYLVRSKTKKRTSKKINWAVKGED